MSEALRDLIAAHDRILVFTGAGISVDSGIPDFRSPGGVWTRIDPLTLSADRIHGGPCSRWPTRWARRCRTRRTTR